MWSCNQKKYRRSYRGKLVRKGKSATKSVRKHVFAEEVSQGGVHSPSLLLLQLMRLLYCCRSTLVCITGPLEASTIHQLGLLLLSLLFYTRQGYQMSGTRLRIPLVPCDRSSDPGNYCPTLQHPLASVFSDQKSFLAARLFILPTLQKLCEWSPCEIRNNFEATHSPALCRKKCHCFTGRFVTVKMRLRPAYSSESNVDKCSQQTNQ